MSHSTNHALRIMWYGTALDLIILSVGRNKQTFTKFTLDQFNIYNVKRGPMKIAIDDPMFN